MPTHLSNYFKERRLQLGLGLGGLSRLVGYSSGKAVGRGAARIDRFERTGVIHPALVERLSAALGIGSGTVDALVEKDRRQFFAEWVAWANEPIQPYLVVRLLPAFYVSEPLPDDVMSVEQAERHASRRAREWGRRCCLVVSRRFSVWVDEQGKVYDRTEAVPGEPNTPYMRLGRSRRPFLVRSVSPDIIQQVQWPRRQGPHGE